MHSVKDLLFARKSNNLVVIALSMALGGTLAGSWMRPNQAVAVDRQATSTEQKATLARIEDAFTSIAEKVEPTVVTIEARATVRQSSQDRPQLRRRQPDGDPGDGNDNDNNGPSFPFDFFRNFQGPNTGPSPAGGSGVIVREQGNNAYILTNNHVVRGRDKFRITMNDKSEYDATLVGADEKSDLAVLKITTTRPLSTASVAELGDSSRVRVGQWAIAIGSPLNYDSTLTVGVISAKGRTLDGVSGRSSYSDLLQTDAAINPGNSGGPLVNIDGQVVGINVAIASAPGAAGNIGIGFAIPINTAKEVMAQLIEKGKVTRGWLGVMTSRENRELAQELKEQYGVQGGALVEDVTPGSPADKAGIKREDVIVRFGDRPINNFSELEQSVGTTRPNTRLQVTVMRDRREVTLPLTLSERPSEEELARMVSRRGGNDPSDRNEPQGSRSKFGLTVQEPSTGSEKGVEVVAVAPGSPAEDAGIQAGDIIQKVGRTEVTDLSSFRRAMDAANEKEPLVVRVKVQRTGQTAIRILRP
jgi:serine protease Do